MHLQRGIRSVPAYGGGVPVRIAGQSLGRSSPVFLVPPALESWRCLVDTTKDGGTMDFIAEYGYDVKKGQALYFLVLARPKTRANSQPLIPRGSSTSGHTP